MSCEQRAHAFNPHFVLTIIRIPGRKEHMGQDCVTSPMAQLPFKGIKQLTNVFLFHLLKAHLPGWLSRLGLQAINPWRVEKTTLRTLTFHPTTFPHLYYMSTLSFAHSLLSFTPPSRGHFTDHPRVKQVLRSPLLPQPDRGCMAYQKQHGLWTMKGQV